MPRLIYAGAALADLTELAEFLAQASGDAAIAGAYLSKLQQKCRHLASLPFPVGRTRPELGEGIRSYSFGNHIIFFRCGATALTVIAIVEGHRDISSFFAAGVRWAE
ncbi:type II toxin-antitoxin system RelE/ParE family toxin [Hyphomicrobium sp. B1]|uniref:type II toxin-antitoxin system RelE/ParE family toxin n=1 Tax=Hyphomicrobium sp. B1 TaxID=3075651 RepID=UPI003C2D9D78